MNFQYTKFWVELTDNFHDGFIIKEDDSYFYLCNPFAYEWLCHIDHLDWIEDLSLTPYVKTYHSLLKPNYPDFYKQLDPWYFSFPVTEDDKKHIHQIANFFEHFHYYRSLPYVQRLEKTISRTAFLFPPDIKHRLYLFVSERFEDHQTRLKTLYSKEIQSFIR